MHYVNFCLHRPRISNSLFPSVRSILEDLAGRVLVQVASCMRKSAATAGDGDGMATVTRALAMEIERDLGKKTSHDSYFFFPKRCCFILSPFFRSLLLRDNFWMLSRADERGRGQTNECVHRHVHRAHVIRGRRRTYNYATLTHVLLLMKNLATYANFYVSIVRSTVRQNGAVVSLDKSPRVEDDETFIEGDGDLSLSLSLSLSLFSQSFFSVWPETATAADYAIALSLH